MRLSKYITQEIELIANDFEEFVKNYFAGATDLNKKEMRNNIVGILSYVVDDIEQQQSPAEQELKSKGGKNMPVVDSAAQVHGKQRSDIGLSIVDLARESRALRANILKGWTAQLEKPDDQDFYDLVRFNEVMDEILVESLTRFHAQVEEAKSYFLSVLGHDLRNPLSAIDGCAALLSQSENLQGREAKLVSQIGSSTDKIVAITDNLLELAQFKLAGGLTIDPAPADMGDICAKAISEAKASYPKANFVLNVEGDLTGAWDEMRIGQVLSNLTRNAVEHGQPEGTVTLTARQTAEDVTVSIHNYGPAISPEKQRSLFQRSSKEDSPNPARNLGLGLYIAREITAAHGGMIEVSSTEAEGTVFAIQLPRFKNREKTENP